MDREQIIAQITQVARGTLDSAAVGRNAEIMVRK